MKSLVRSENETAQLAADLAPSLQKGDVVLLHGTLGTGKTVFARSLIRTLTDSADLEVPSPTFTLVQTYNADPAPIYHFDLYRLESPDEIFELGWEEALAEGIVIVEWPERLGPYKPRAPLDISISAVENNDNARQILIEKNS